MEVSTSSSSFQISGNTAELFASLAKAQGAIGGVTRDRQNDQLRNRYATLNAIRETAAPFLAHNGLAIIQWHEITREGTRVVTDKSGSYEASCGIAITHTLLTHSSGAFLKPSPLAIPWLHTRGINEAQAIGVAQTYGARYATTNLLAIAATDAEDTDAEHPVRAAPAEPRKEDLPLPTKSDEIPAFVKSYSTNADHSKAMGWLKFLAGRVHKAGILEGHALFQQWSESINARKESLIAEEERVLSLKAVPPAHAEPGTGG